MIVQKIRLTTSSNPISIPLLLINLLLFTPLLFIPLLAHATEAKTEGTQAIIKSHAIAMHDKPKYPADFEGFEYTSKQAKKGGRIQLYGFGTFNSLNGYIAKGNPDSHYFLLYDSLTVAALDEPFTQYGLVAQTIEYPKDHSWVIFHINPNARFHDNQPITAEDVVFSFKVLIEKGSPIYKVFFRDVKTVEALTPLQVKYTFTNTYNRELALSIGELPIFPQHFWQDKSFDKSSLEIPLGSGPYRIGNVNPGSNLTYERVKDYWAQDLPVNRGLYNFDYVNVDYYRDHSVSIEALKAGEFDYRWENSSKFWATAYNVPPVENGDLIQKKIPHKANSGLQAFIFNLRRPIFQDIELRKAINYAFDFEWSNKTLFYNAYKRSYSYFTNSEFAATGLPSKAELQLLSPYREQLPPRIFTEAYTPPKTDGSGWVRPNLRTAKEILDKAGYKVVKDQLYNQEGQAIKFEILLYSPAFERIINPFIKNLSRLGIIATIRLVDTSQYINRNRTFDFDMRVHSFSQSESPGNEQREYWGSAAANIEGSGNHIGIKNPVIDELLENITAATNREQLMIATRALDRVLLHHHYMVPNWYSPSSRIVYWNKFDIPDIAPIYDRQYQKGIFTWWYNADKAEKLKSKHAD